MNRKELIQRWRNALGYGQKEMFYYPVKKDKKICNKLTINTFLYKYYDFETKKFVGKGLTCLTQILIKDITTQKIIYCNKSSKNYSSSVVLNNIPYGKYSLRVISAVYGYVDNTEHIIDVNCEEFNCDIPVKTNIIIIEQYIENKPLDYYLTPNMNGDSNIDSIQITGGVKYKYLDMDNNSLFNTEYVRLPYNTLKTDIWSRHNSIFVYFNFISFPYWEYIDNLSFTASYKNGSLKKTQAEYQCGYYTYDDSKKKYVPYHFNIDEIEIQDSQETYEIIPYNIYFHMQLNCIGTYRYNNDDYDTIVESQVDDFGRPPIINKYAICPQYSQYYDLLDSRTCWLENIHPTYSIEQILNNFCNAYVGRSDFSLDNYNVNIINQEWFHIGLNNLLIYIYNATKGMLSSIEYSTVLNYKQLQNGVQISGGYLIDSNVSKESIENYAAVLEQKTGGTSYIEYHITDMPSLINTDSSLIKHFINNVKIYKKDSNKKNVTLLSLNPFNVKYNNKYFRTSLFPIETKTNKEVFICGLDSQFDFCEDYDSLSAVYL